MLVFKCRPDTRLWCGGCEIHSLAVWRFSCAFLHAIFRTHDARHARTHARAHTRAHTHTHTRAHTRTEEESTQQATLRKVNKTAYGALRDTGHRTCKGVLYCRNVILPYGTRFSVLLLVFVLFKMYGVL
jgi:ABC-type nickel/cobalt efflux system permease component RcnA